MDIFFKNWWLSVSWCMSIWIILEIETLTMCIFETWKTVSLCLSCNLCMPLSCTMWEIKCYLHMLILDIWNLDFACIKWIFWRCLIPVFAWIYIYALWSLGLCEILESHVLHLLNVYVCISMNLSGLTWLGNTEICALLDISLIDFTGILRLFVGSPV